MKIVAALLLAFLFADCQAQSDIKFASKGKSDYQLSDAQEEFIDSVQRNAFKYFLHEINPENGLVKDRTASWSAASIAAVGFAIPSYAVGAERNWITREEAAKMVNVIIDFFLNSRQDSVTSATGYKGFYYHFLNMKTGKRDYHCELSTVDTGWLIAGIIFARQYFNLNNEV